MITIRNKLNLKENVVQLCSKVYWKTRGAKKFIKSSISPALVALTDNNLLKMSEVALSTQGRGMSETFNIEIDMCY